MGGEVERGGVRRVREIAQVVEDDGVGGVIRLWRFGCVAEEGGGGFGGAVEGFVVAGADVVGGIEELGAAAGVAEGGEELLGADARGEIVEMGAAGEGELDVGEVVEGAL